MLIHSSLTFFSFVLKFRYHSLYTEEEKIKTEDEEHFQKTAVEFKDQFQGMVNKYQFLLMKESVVSRYVKIFF